MEGADSAEKKASFAFLIKVCNDALVRVQLAPWTAKLESFGEGAAAMLGADSAAELFDEMLGFDINQLEGGLEGMKEAADSDDTKEPAK
eukprot:SAG22_NODE_20353_length_266_cov_0.916168_1_plen_88_part_11